MLLWPLHTARSESWLWQNYACLEPEGSTSGVLYMLGVRAAPPRIEEAANMVQRINSEEKYNLVFAALFQVTKLEMDNIKKEKKRWKRKSSWAAV